MSKREKIMVVESDDSLRKIACRFLSESNEVIGSSSSLEALRLLSIHSDISLILFSSNLEMDTDSFLRGIRSSGLHRNIALVSLCEASEEAIIDAQCTTYKPNAFLHKPFNPLRLDETLYESLLITT